MLRLEFKHRAFPGITGIDMLSSNILITYLALNGVLAIAYLALRLTLRLPNLQNKLLKKQQLKLLRLVVPAIFFAFLSIPLLIGLLPFPTLQINFQLPLSFHDLGTHVLLHAMHIVAPSEPLKAVYSAEFYAENTLLLFFIVGILYSFGKYVLEILAIRKIIALSFLLKKHQHVHLVISEHVSVPFSWSFFTRSYVVIPSDLLDKPIDLGIAIAHELQHIRQLDTLWIHLQRFLNMLFFWNPFINRWMRWCSEQQEYACDEALILRKNYCPIRYGNCLLAAARSSLSAAQPTAENINKKEKPKSSAQSALGKRVTNLFSYGKKPYSQWLITFAAIIIFSVTFTIALLVGNYDNPDPLTRTQLTAIISQLPENSMSIQPTPEILGQINAIRTSKTARKFFHNSLNRMEKYRPMLEDYLRMHNMPSTIMALPLIASGYKELQPIEGKPNSGAGIWQIDVVTARLLGLTVTRDRDDRLNAKLASIATLQELQAFYQLFGSWDLALLAYLADPTQLQQLIEETHSRDPWIILRSPFANDTLMEDFSQLLASMLVLQSPQIIDR